MHSKIPIENNMFCGAVCLILLNFINSVNFVYGILVKLQNSVGGFSIMTLLPLRLKSLNLPKEIHFSKLQTLCVMELKRKTLG